MLLRKTYETYGAVGDAGSPLPPSCLGFRPFGSGVTAIKPSVTPLPRPPFSNEKVKTVEGRNDQDGGKGKTV
ncbi:hypothetical protein [Longirhabdus pacifica]|uniref:hypothetical protein n=1 Tax=Longirhabdus pacifica TaxID=2305227 RepID=UPI001008A572|nr:hypothetical protein [Longirhabdus pacifica]